MLSAWCEKRVYQRPTALLSLWLGFSHKEHRKGHSPNSHLHRTWADTWMTCGQRETQDPVPGSDRPGAPAACTGERLRWPDRSGGGNLAYEGFPCLRGQPARWTASYSWAMWFQGWNSAHTLCPLLQLETQQLMVRQASRKSRRPGPGVAGGNGRVGCPLLSGQEAGDAWDPSPMAGDSWVERASLDCRGRRPEF